MNRKTFDAAFLESHKSIRDQIPVIEKAIRAQFSDTGKASYDDLIPVISVEIFKLCDLHMKNVLEKLFEVTD